MLRDFPVLFDVRKVELTRVKFYLHGFEGLSRTRMTARHARHAVCASRAVGRGVRRGV